MKTQLGLMLGVCGVMAACGGDDGGHQVHDSKDASTTSHIDGGTNGLMDSGSGGSSDVGAVCTSLCTGAVAAHCPADDNKTCVSDCAASFAQLPSACRTQASIAFKCASTATFACDSDGESEPVGCDDQFAALEVCIDQAGGGQATPDGGGHLVDGGVAQACAPEADDEACDTCAKTQCCDALAACGDDCNALASCVIACDPSDVPCQDACSAQVSTVVVRQLNGVLDCYGDTCGAACQ